MADPETHEQGEQPKEISNEDFQTRHGRDDPIQDEQKMEDESSRRDTEELSEGLSEDGSGERPVRQKLKETSITGHLQPPDEPSAASTESNSPNNDDRGRLRKKRSFDESREGDNPDTQMKNEDECSHRRKRSRSSKAEENADEQAKEVKPQENRERTPSRQRLPENDPEKVLSPKKKRSRDQLDKDEELDATRTENKEGKDSKEKFDTGNSKPVIPGNRTQEGEPEKKRHRDSSQERDITKEDSSSKTSLPNPFANASATSPFADLKAPPPAETTAKEDEQPASQPVTSASAFASSGLAAFAGSEKSPFGAIGGGTSVFKSLKPVEASTVEKKDAAPSGASPSPFAATGASPFGALPGGFASSAFASFTSSAPAVTGGLTSFASPAAATTSFGSSAKPKAFGAASDNEDDDEEEDEDTQRPAFEGLEEVKEDERFFKQDIETGEENETTICSCRGKLFQFDGKEWKERGIGTFKINASEPAGKDEKTARSVRIIMRTDAVLRVVLNTPIYKGMEVGSAGKEPEGKQLSFTGIHDGKSTPFLLRTGNASTAKDVYHSIQSVISKM